MVHVLCFIVDPRKPFLKSNDKTTLNNLGTTVGKNLEEDRFTPSPNLDAMLANSQKSGSESLQAVGLGATIGMTFGPIGAAVGAVAGALLCIIICTHGNLLLPNFQSTYALHMQFK